MKLMKELKLSALICTLLAGTMFTSCLDSDDSDSDNGYYTISGVVKVVNASYFVDGAGNYFYPTSTSLSSVASSYGFDIYNTNLAYIYGTAQLDASGTGTGYTLSLSTAYSIDAPVEIVREGETDVTETAPVISLSYSAYSEYYGNVLYSPDWFDSTTLIIPICWFMTSSSSFYSSHTFTLAFYPSELEEGDTQLTLYLRHDRGNDAGTETSVWDWFGYDLTTVLNAYADYSGNSKPTTVVIKDKENSSSVDLESSNTVENSYSISYKY
ncbi:MAG: hypothetical protein LUC23_00860 [Prevotellaceae bacterium]|nr:hypothetical protein [Prevotellaceae bacterium]